MPSKDGNQHFDARSVQHTLNQLCNNLPPCRARLLAATNAWDVAVLSSSVFCLLSLQAHGGFPV
jgi:hypothetical protein